MTSYMHSDPNFSEGRRPEVIEAIVDQLRGREGVKVIGYYPDPDFNRTPVEVIGRPVALKEALLDMAGKSYELIDMEQHTGGHPRIGAQDTIDFYPLANASVTECTELAEELGQEIYSRYNVPVYFTGENARSEDRKYLDLIRGPGQYEVLKDEVTLPGRAPDIGPAALHPTAGATIVGSAATHGVYMNVLLGTTDIDIAKRLAKMVRGTSEGFVGVRAIGVPQSRRGCVTVSLNVFDPSKTPLHRIFNVLKSEAGRYAVPIVGSQICGVLPQSALVDCAEWYLRLEGVEGAFDHEQIIENHLIDLAAEALSDGVGREG